MIRIPLRPTIPGISFHPLRCGLSCWRQTPIVYFWPLLSGVMKGGKENTKTLQVSQGLMQVRSRTNEMKARSNEVAQQGHQENGYTQSSTMIPAMKTPKSGVDVVLAPSRHHQMQIRRAVCWRVLSGKRIPVTGECFRYKLKRIRDVKQHLRRSHCRSYCVRCGAEGNWTYTINGINHATRLSFRPSGYLSYSRRRSGKVEQTQSSPLRASGIQSGTFFFQKHRSPVRPTWTARYQRTSVRFWNFSTSEVQTLFERQERVSDFIRG